VLTLVPAYVLLLIHRYVLPEHMVQTCFEMVSFMSVKVRIRSCCNAGINYLLSNRSMGTIPKPPEVTKVTIVE
jgi:hypothetical protein